MVIDDSGVCVSGATIVVIAGQAAGRSAAQQTPCGAWDDIGGFVFNNLTPGLAMTLRVSAPGYLSLDTTLVPILGGQAHLIAPIKQALVRRASIPGAAPLNP